MVVKACAIALREHPRANAAYRDGAFELYERVNVGIAVATDDSLIVPTVFDADRKPLLDIAREARTLAERVRSRQITPAELSGATFTVSNLGMYGVTNFAAIINPPQAAILAVGELRELPVVRDGQVVPGSRMSIVLTCDHRILYGAPRRSSWRASASCSSSRSTCCSRPSGSQGPCQPPKPATSSSASFGPHEPWRVGVDRRRGVEQRLDDPPALLDVVLAGEMRWRRPTQRGVEQHLVRRRALAALLRELHVELDLVRARARRRGGRRGSSGSRSTGRS